MGYVKLVKNKNYYKRFKVKMRRRRECKTDYALRRTLIKQDKRKYNTPKWRFIVRKSNTDVICQVASSKMIGDQILCAAYSHELKRYGLNVGLTNYAAFYCTGLLLARRLLKKLKLDKVYPGKKKLDGNKFRSQVTNVRWKPNDKICRPFKCLLDIGLARASTGARVFAALKGAVDGGLDIPHSERRFPGFKQGKGDEKDEYQADVHADKIFGGHIRDYMEKLKDIDSEKYAKHFSQYIAAGLDADKLKEKYAEVHRKIRANPSAPPKKERDYKTMKLFPKHPKKLSAEVRRERRIARIKELAKIEAKKKNNDVMDDDEEE
eukprot:CAMPEP_0202708848 /NCGR_PEP_ID=MMETSP1385-20130828/21005_1 /ASSEMBLY_ACC=CAM_ASM_000861 /TAXON_ID=933848 /ORGANISM="Elphidium margaritaceum" /LENGTH=320 /DNA_ID=CAMNT_0049367939 /DNA_START=93 /DNA_END=1055 /DNA_ORIENTATION=-